MQSVFGADAEEAVSVEGISDEEDVNLADSVIPEEEEKKGGPQPSKGREEGKEV